jgi:hypothetical protein
MTLGISYEWPHSNPGPNGAYNIVYYSLSQQLLPICLHLYRAYTLFYSKKVNFTSTEWGYIPDPGCLVLRSGGWRHWWPSCGRTGPPRRRSHTWGQSYLTPSLPLQPPSTRTRFSKHVHKMGFVHSFRTILRCAWNIIKSYFFFLFSSLLI